MTMICISLLSCNGQDENKFNLNFEQLDSLRRPSGWKLSSKQLQPGFVSQLDSEIKQEGRYSLSMSKTKDFNAFGSCAYVLPAPAKGKRIRLTGFIKTENVMDGYAALWIRIDDVYGDMLHLNNMQATGITGTHDWGKYSIELPYDAGPADKIVIGALLTGSGKIWVDNLKATIDGKSMRQSAVKETNASARSIIEHFEMPTLKLTPDKIQELANLGMVWGFIKYHHPDMARGKYNIDEELFRLLSKILEAGSPAETNLILETWVDSLGSFPPCSVCPEILENKTKYKADYSSLFDGTNIPLSLINKLAFIRDNHPVYTDHHYIALTRNNNPVFKNEHSYSNIPFPNLKLRLLSLYRYWNMILYFYPYRYLIAKDWNGLMNEFIPKFVNAKNKAEYTLACLELIGRTRDTHANIWGINPTLDSVKGLQMTPFQAKFIEGKLVVTGYYTDLPGLKEQIHPGDIISGIDGTPVEVLIKKFRKLTPASNYSAQLRDLPSCRGFLLRSNDSVARLSIVRNGNEMNITVPRIPLSSANMSADYVNVDEKSGYQLINKDIGYIYPAKLIAKDIDSMKILFKNTKGIIIDLRCYPATFMPFTYGSWFKPVSSSFAKFSNMTLGMPGAIIKGNEVFNGDPSAKHYTGRLVMIVNSLTQSQAEYTAMALSTVPGSLLVGDTTAGADGDVSEINLPGGIQTMISGLGVCYPDQTETQGAGVKIDVILKPTIKGILAGRDELLEKAVLLTTSKK